MALTGLYINKIVESSTNENAAEGIKSLYGVTTISCNGRTYYDGDSIITALLAENVDNKTAADIKAGAVVEWPKGTKRYWIVLENDTKDTSNSVLKLISKNIIAKRPYGNTNNFAKSQLFASLNAMSATPGGTDWKLVYPGLDGIVVSDLVSFDAGVEKQSKIIAQNGETDYATDWSGVSNRYVSLLNAEEFKTYYDDDGVLKYSGASVGSDYWLLTPSGCGCQNREVVIVRNDNTLGSRDCGSACGVRPIIMLKIAKTEKIQVAQLKLGS